MRTIDASFMILVLGFLASFYMAWNIGANDAANPTDTAIGSGALSLEKALIIFSVSALIGALTQGWIVMTTLGEGIVTSIEVTGALCAVLAAGIWVLTASLKGMPISTSQSITGGVLGIGLAYVALGRMSIQEINWGVVTNILLSWVTSPALSIVLAIIFYKVFSKVALVLKSKNYESGKIMRFLIIASLVFSAYSFGANDVGNATGVYYTVALKYIRTPDISTRIMLALIGSIGIMIGGYTVGKRVINTVAYKITRLDLVSGLPAEYSNALTIWMYTTIPYIMFGYGMPVSTTHASVSSIIGVGIARDKSFKNINLKTVKDIIKSWLLILPITALLSFLLRLGIHYFLYL